MSTKKLINRDSIYIGQIAKIYGVKEHNKENLCKYVLQIEEGDLYYLSFVPYRSILFTLDENRFSTDLLYDSPKYPILNITDKGYFDELRKDKGNNHGMVVVKDSYNLDELLKRFNFDDELSLEDIIRIRQKIFNSKFLYDNCKEFGLRRSLPPSNVTHISIVDMPKTHYPTLIRNKLIYLFAKMFRQEGFEMDTCQSYAKNFYMLKYWYAIRNLGDDELLDFFSKGFDINLDAFKPAKIEGPIKKLIK